MVWKQNWETASLLVGWALGFIQRRERMGLVHRRQMLVKLSPHVGAGFSSNQEGGKVRMWGSLCTVL